MRNNTNIGCHHIIEPLNWHKMFLLWFRGHLKHLICLFTIIQCYLTESLKSWSVRQIANLCLKLQGGAYSCQKNAAVPSPVKLRHYSFSTWFSSSWVQQELCYKAEMWLKKGNFLENVLQTCRKSTPEQCHPMWKCWRWVWKAVRKKTMHTACKLSQVCRLSYCYAKIFKTFC